MGRDIDFCHNEIDYAFSELHYSLKRESFVGYKVKTHRTEYYHDNEKYEDYGELIWMDEDGNKKKKGKKKVSYEEQTYHPDDYTKKWKVSICPGDFYAVVLCYPFRNEIIVGVCEVEGIETDGVDSTGVEKVKIRDKNWGGLRIYTLERNEVIKKIHEHFDEKFWNVLDKVATRIDEMYYSY